MLKPKAKKKPAKKSPASAAAKRQQVTIKHDKFVNALVRGLDQKEAAAEAGIGYEYARKLSRQPKIQEMLKKAREELRAVANIGAKELIDALLPTINIDIRKLYNNDGTVKPISEWPEDLGKAVASFQVDELTVGEVKIGVIKNIRFWSKTDATDKVAKMLGAYKDQNVNHTVTATVAGMSDVLKEIAAEGADVGPGPARSRRG